MRSDDGLYWDVPAATDADVVHDRLFAGAIARFRALPAVTELIAFTRAFLERDAGADPTLIHLRPDAELAEVCADLQRRFANAAAAKRLWRALFAAVGLDPDDSMRDRLMLRFQPPRPADGDRRYARSTATVGFHRDTWGTNLAAQVNWWAPVYPVTAGRTFAFLPALFAVPLANDSAVFDLAAVMAQVREGTGERLPLAPRPTDAIDLADAQAVTIAPGELILFSSQHAHVGVGNDTDRTRISLETRTLRLADHRAGRGARNVDGRGKWIAYTLFRRVSDGTPLHDLLGCAPLEPFQFLEGVTSSRSG